MTIEIPMMDEREARKVTERIRIAAYNYTEARTKLMQRVQEAKDGQAHSVLGYQSWQAYLAEVLGEEPLRLARDERQDMVHMLANEGMSTRAIAPIVGASQRQVARDVATEPNGSVAEPRVSHGLDGKTRTHQPRPAAVEEFNQPLPVEIEDEVLEERPEAKGDSPRPDSTIKQFSGAVAELNKVLDKLYRLRENQNFARNREQIATLHSSDLNRAISELQTLADALN